MKKLLLALFLLLPSLAQAQIISPLPVTLTNGTLADANQVMSDFNAIVTGVNTNAAHNGANSDITSLSALSTPITPTQGGTNVYIGAGSGTANVQLVVTPTPINFSLTSGYTVNFIPSISNTSATTLSVAGTTAKAVLRQTSAGLQPLVGGEIVINQMATVIYDGTQYELINSAVTANVQPCMEADFQGIAVPTGYLAEDGTTKSRTTFAALFACLSNTAVAATTTSGNASVAVADSTSYQVGWYVGGSNVTCNSTILSKADGTHITISNNAGSSGATTLSIGPFQQGDCSTTFTLPDMRGRASVGADTTGNTVLAAAACTNAGSIGSKCGSVTQLMAQNNLPNAPIQDSRQYPFTYTTQSFQNGTGAGLTFVLAIQSSGGTTTLRTSLADTGSDSINGNVTQQPLLLQPIGLVTKAIKF